MSPRDTVKISGVATVYPHCINRLICLLYCYIFIHPAPHMHALTFVHTRTHIQTHTHRDTHNRTLMGAAEFKGKLSTREGDHITDLDRRRELLIR